MSAKDGNSQTQLFLRARSSRWPDSALVVASVVFAIAVGAFILWRRAVGAIDAPMPAVRLLGTAIGLTAWATFVRAVSTNSQAANWTVLGVLILFALGCSYPDVRVVDWLVWCSASAIIFCA